MNESPSLPLPCSPATRNHCKGPGPQSRGTAQDSPCWFPVPQRSVCKHLVPVLSHSLRQVLLALPVIRSGDARPLGCATRTACTGSPPNGAMTPAATQPVAQNYLAVGCGGAVPTRCHYRPGTHDSLLPRRCVPLAFPGDGLGACRELLPDADLGCAAAATGGEEREGKAKEHARSRAAAVPAEELRRLDLGHIFDGDGPHRYRRCPQWPRAYTCRRRRRSGSRARPWCGPWGSRRCRLADHAHAAPAHTVADVARAHGNQPSRPVAWIGVVDGNRSHFRLLARRGTDGANLVDCFAARQCHALWRLALRGRRRRSTRTGGCRRGSGCRGGHRRRGCLQHR